MPASRTLSASNWRELRNSGTDTRERRLIFQMGGLPAGGLDAMKVAQDAKRTSEDDERLSKGPGRRELLPSIRHSLGQLSERMQKERPGEPPPLSDPLTPHKGLAERMQQYLKSLGHPERAMPARELFESVVKQAPELSLETYGLSVLHNVSAVLNGQACRDMKQMWQTRRVPGRDQPFALVKDGLDDPSSKQRVKKQKDGLSEPSSEQKVEKQIDPIVSALSVPEVCENDEPTAIAKAIRAHRYLYMEDHIVRVSAHRINGDIQMLEKLRVEPSPLSQDGKAFAARLVAVLHEFKNADLLSSFTQTPNPSIAQHNAAPEIQNAVNSVRILGGLVLLALMALALLVERRKIANGQLPFVTLLYAGLAIVVLRPGIFSGRYVRLREQMSFMHDNRWNTIAPYFAGTAPETRQRIAEDLVDSDVRKLTREYVNAERPNEDAYFKRLTDLRVRKETVDVLRAMHSSDVAARRSRQSSHLHYFLTHTIGISGSDAQYLFAQFIRSGMNAQTMGQDITGLLQGGKKDEEQKKKKLASG